MVSVGIDEVGRGCWAGPLVAGAVILPRDTTTANSVILLRDSKKLTKRQREVSAAWIHEHSPAVGLGWVQPEEIDTLGITESVRLAMQRALDGIQADYDEIIIDGNLNYFEKNPKARALIKADEYILGVSAASIVAKVARDRYMAGIAKKYAGYGFETHVGYGTAAHIAALNTYGVTEIHRRSYKPIRSLLDA